MSEAKREILPKPARVAIICVGAVLLAVMGWLIIRAVFRSSDIESKRIAVYRSGNETIIDINGFKRSCGELDTGSFTINEESERVFFTAVSAYDDTLFDLYYCEINNLGEIIQPKLIDYAVQGDYTVSYKGDSVYYLKYNSGSAVVEANVCDISENSITVIADNVEQMYVLPVQEEVYFTKMHSATKVLYLYAGEAPKELCRGVSGIMLYDDCEKPHIVFEELPQDGSASVNLYIAYSGQEPELIAQNVSNVMYDHYKSGGNLYYFKTTKQAISWTAVIADEYRETDKNITKPQRTNFFSIFGVSAEYNKALREYQDKQIRDEIRTALDTAFSEGTFEAPLYTAYAYTGETCVKLADEVNPGDIYSVSEFGTPKIIYESVKLTAATTDISALVTIAERNSIDDVIDYAASVVSKGIESQGMALSVYTGSGSADYKLAGYDTTKTLFSFTKDGSGFFAFVKDGVSEKVSVYASSLSGEKLQPSTPITVDTNVTSYVFTEDEMLYLKLDSGKNYGDLFSFTQNGKTKVFNAVSAFLVRSGSGVTALKNYQNSIGEPTADYFTILDGDEVPVDSGIIISSFSANSVGRMAYLVPAQSGSGNEFRMFENGTVVTIDEDVSEIIAFR